MNRVEWHIVCCVVMADTAEEPAMSQYRPTLTESERQALLQLRDHAPKPYLRERAAAVLKSAEGVPIMEIAAKRLLRKRKPDTVRRWLKRFAEAGLAGLNNKPGAGRKPAFSPSLR